MDRRILLLAEPAPLLSISSTPSAAHSATHNESDGGPNGSADAQKYWRKHARDLQHIGSVIDSLNSFCICHSHDYSAGEMDTGDARSLANSGRNGAAVQERNAGYGKSSKPGGTTTQGQGRCTYHGDSTTSRRQQQQSGRRILLAAVYPCSAIFPAVHDTDNLLSLAIAFDAILDSCGTWLSPEDFLYRILEPTRALINAQLARIREAMAPQHQLSRNDDGSFGASTVAANALSCSNDDDDRDSSNINAAARSSHGGQPSGTGEERGRGIFDDFSLVTASTKPKQWSIKAGCSIASPEYDDKMPITAVSRMVNTPATAATAAETLDAYIQDAVAEISILVQDALLADGMLAGLASNGGAAGTDDTVAEEVAAAAALGCDGLAYSGANARVTSRRVLLDIIWAASSMPSNDPDLSPRPSGDSSVIGRSECAKLLGMDGAVSSQWNATERIEQGGRTASINTAAGVLSKAVNGTIVGQPGGALRSGNVLMSGSISVSTPSVLAGDPRESPLRGVLHNASSLFTDSLLTIWPAPAAVIDATVGEEEQMEPAARTIAAVHDEWSDWRTSLGASLYVSPGAGDARTHGVGRALAGSDPVSNTASSPVPAAMENVLNPADPGLLWRGPIVPAATRVARATHDPTRGSPSTVIGVAPHASKPASGPPSPRRQSRNSSGVFPALEGFAIRTAAAPSALKTNFKKDDGHDFERNHGLEAPNALRSGNGRTGRISVTSESILSRASELRLARVISPVELARVCHLLADGGVAPPLELFVYDPQKFPGSAAFLEDWGKDGRGMLLVAAGTVASAPVSSDDGAARERGEGGGGAMREEGLAMVCFPHRGRQHASTDGSNGDGEVCCGVAGSAGKDRRSAVVWNITLFRTPNEFSEAAVNALVGESASSIRGTWTSGGKTTARADSMKICHNQATTAPEAARSAKAKLWCEQRCIGGDEATDTLRRRFPDLVTSMPRYTAETLHREAVALVRQAEGADSIPPCTPAVESLQSEPASSTIRRFTSSASKLRSPTAASANVSESSPSTTTETNESMAVDEPPTNETTSSGKRKQQGASATVAAKRKRSGEQAQSITSKATAMITEESSGTDDPTVSQVVAKLIAVMDARAARVVGPVVEPSVAQPPIDEPASDEAAALAAARDSFALYGSFGAWGQEGRFCWAEEFLLPSSQSIGVSLAGASVEAGHDRSGTAAEARGRDGQEGGRYKDSSAFAQGNTRGVLSSAEEALEKAGRQQRERVRERRLVAREQRDRLDRTRPRPRSPNDSGSGSGSTATGAHAGGAVRRAASGSSSSSVRTNGGGGNGAFRRGGVSSSVPPPPPPLPPLGVAGRSGSTSKLSRGNRLLGKSIALGTTTTGSGRGGETTGGDKWRRGATSKRQQQSVGTGMATSATSALGSCRRSGSSTGAVAAAGRGGGTQQSRAVLPRAERPVPSPIAGPREPPTRKRSRDAGRVWRASFQDDAAAARQPQLEPELHVSPATAPSAQPISTAAAAVAVGNLAAVDVGTSAAGAGAAVVSGGLGKAIISDTGFNVCKSDVTSAGVIFGGKAGVAGGGEGVDSGVLVYPSGDVGNSGLNGDFSMRRVMERAMLSAIAAQMGLAEDDPRVRDVFQRESRLMAGGGAVPAVERTSETSAGV